MADHHRIHPVGTAVPPPPSAPAAPDSLSELEKRGAADHALPPPPKRRGRCCRCLCCAAATVAVAAVLLGATAGILYLVFRPKIPEFHVDRLAVTRFDVGDDMVVRDGFAVEVTARNPNRRIGVYYDGGGSSVTARYNGTELCSGQFPTLYQGHRSTVVLNITLAGETRLDSRLVLELRRQQEAGYVPLTVTARVPLRIKFGAVRLWTMTGKARCSLVVDNLMTSDQIRIRSNDCKFKLKL